MSTRDFLVKTLVIITGDRGFKLRRVKNIYFKYTENISLYNFLSRLTRLSRKNQSKHTQSKYIQHLKLRIFYYNQQYLNKRALYKSRLGRNIILYN